MSDPTLDTVCSKNNCSTSDCSTNCCSVSNNNESVEQTLHEERTQPNSLSTPWNLPAGTTPVIETSALSLSSTELKEAKSALYKNEFIRKFPRVERRFADPPVHLQRYGLVSFVPSAGATPDEKGVFGFLKLRGNYDTEHEASEQAERLIRETDSYHKIYTAYVGRPFPITVSSDFSKDVTEVNLQKDMANTISEDVKKKREKEKKDIAEIKERERNLLEETKREVEEPKEVYKTLCVKKANLCWQYIEQRKAMEQMKQSIIRTRRQIQEIDDVDPEPRATYFEEYMRARGERDLDTKDQLNNFMKYLINEPEDLGF